MFHTPQAAIVLKKPTYSNLIFPILYLISIAPECEPCVLTNLTWDI